MANIQAVGADNAAGATTLVATIASSGGGNFLGCFVETFSTGATSVTDNQSQTWTNSGVTGLSGSGERIQFFYMKNSLGGVTTVTANIPSGPGIIFAFEESGIDTAVGIDITPVGSTSQAAVTSWTSGTLTTVTANAILYGACVTGSGISRSFAVGSGWSTPTGTGITGGVHDNTTDSDEGFIERQVAGAAGNYQANGTCITSAVATLGVALRPASTASSQSSTKARPPKALRLGTPLSRLRGRQVTDASSSIPGPLSGSGISVTIGAGNLTAAAALAGSGISSTTGAGALTGSASIAGSGISATIGSGALTGAAFLAGSGISTTIGAGAITAFIGGSGISATIGAGALSGLGALAASGISATIGAGNLLGSASLSGSGVSVTIGSGDLQPFTSGSISGSGISTTVGAGNLVATAAMSGSGISATIGSGNLQPFIPGGIVGTYYVGFICNVATMDNPNAHNA